MNSVEKFLKSSNLDNLCVTGTKIGEQAYLISKLSSPIFFIVGDSETAFKAEQQLIVLNKKVGEEININGNSIVRVYGTSVINNNIYIIFK